MGYVDFLARTGRHIGVIERDTKGHANPPRRGSWAAMLAAEEAARERAKQYEEDRK